MVADSEDENAINSAAVPPFGVVHITLYPPVITEADTDAPYVNVPVYAFDLLKSIISSSILIVPVKGYPEPSPGLRNRDVATDVISLNSFPSDAKGTVTRLLSSFLRMSLPCMVMLPLVSGPVILSMIYSRVSKFSQSNGSE